MIRHLCKIKFIERAVLRYAFTRQKPGGDEFAKMKSEFFDSNGKEYFRYHDPFDMSAPRFEQLQIKLRQIEARISYEHIDQWIGLAEKILIQKDKEKAVVECIQALGGLKERRTMLIEPDLLMRACCIIYVREDQNPKIWDEALEEEKYEQLNKDKAGGLYDFFAGAGLKRYLPSPKDMADGLESFLENQNAQADLFEEMIQSATNTLTTNYTNMLDQIVKKG